MSVPERLALLTVIVALCAGCAATPDTRAAPEAPERWQRGGLHETVGLRWLGDLDDDTLALDGLIVEALTQNYQLKQEAARLAQAREAVVVARADRLPDLNLSLDGSRRESGLQGVNSITQQYELGFDSQWQIDAWGRLGKLQRAAALELAAQEARYEAARRQLAADVAATLFDFIEARQLLIVFQSRLDNVTQSLDIVESGYRQGLNEALDLYLAQTAVQQEKANLEQQRQALAEATARLQLLLARYPDGSIASDATLPLIDTDVPVGLPSELLTRRPDLRQAWFGLLAADARTAAAHRARFPNISLVGSGGSASADLSDVLSTDDPVWSLLASVSTPLFDGGRLRALERQSAARAREAEQQYLELAYRAFAEVENALSRAQTLTGRYNAFVLAEKNAAAALELALEQYQGGLVPYTTVLESQRRAFDATTTVVRLRNQRLQNRIALHLAVGGEFEMDRSE